MIVGEKPETHVATMTTKAQIPTITNPALPVNTRVKLGDDREARIVDQADHRSSRLIAIVGVTGVHMWDVGDFKRAWPGGVEKVCVFDGRALTKPPGIEYL